MMMTDDGGSEWREDNEEIEMIKNGIRCQIRYPNTLFTMDFFLII